LRLLSIRAAIVCLALLVLGQAVFGQAAKKAASKSASKTGKAAPSTVNKSATTKSAPRGNTKAVSTKAGSKSKKAVVVRRPLLQQQPTPERYKEIQQALADRGYFRGMPDGNWGPDSVEALKRFQREQNLDSDGKIGALSLMALGLGPKRGADTAQAGKGVPEAVDPPPAAQPEP